MTSDSGLLRRIFDRHADEIQAALGLLSAVTADAMLIERPLDVRDEVDHANARIARLRRKRLGWVVQGQGRGARGAWRTAARLVAPDAGAMLTGLEVHEGPHALDLHEVLVEGLEGR